MFSIHIAHSSVTMKSKFEEKKQVENNLNNKSHLRLMIPVFFVAKFSFCGVYMQPFFDLLLLDNYVMFAKGFLKITCTRHLSSFICLLRHYVKEWIESPEYFLQ